MVRLTAIKLRFLSPLRVGEPGVGIEHAIWGLIHSDTLWAAIVWGWSKIIGDPKPLLDDPTFRLSSAFPYGYGLYFFPVPLEPATLLSKIPPDYRKELRKVRFLPQSYFEKWVCGEELLPKDVEEIRKSHMELQNKILPLFEPHVRLGPVAYEPEFYYLGAVSFDEGWGLYFLMEGEVPEEVFWVLDFLSEEGLGGKRNRGFGVFRWKREVIELKVPEDAQRWILLSVMNPGEGDPIEELRRSYFNVYLQRGWSLSPCGVQLMRSPVMMILEGSILSFKPKGRVVDVTPAGIAELPHRIYRHGLAFSIAFGG